jgi:transcriptional regulator NrdR family protein
MKHVVKQQGSIESFDNRKVYASIYASCLSVHEPSAAAELIAEKVTNDVEAWLKTKNEVTATDIRQVAGKSLNKINPHAGYLYLHHRIMW